MNSSERPWLTSQSVECCFKGEIVSVLRGTLNNWPIGPKAKTNVCGSSTKWPSRLSPACYPRSPKSLHLWNQLSSLSGAIYWDSCLCSLQQHNHHPSSSNTLVHYFVTNWNTCPSGEPKHGQERWRGFLQTCRTKLLNGWRAREENKACKSSSVDTEGWTRKLYSSNLNRFLINASRSSRMWRYNNPSLTCGFLGKPLKMIKREAVGSYMIFDCRNWTHI